MDAQATTGQPAPVEVVRLLDGTPGEVECPSRGTSPGHTPHEAPGVH